MRSVAHVFRQTDASSTVRADNSSASFFFLLVCRLTKEEKDALIADMVSGLAAHGSSKVLVAYEMMCGPAAAPQGTGDMAACLSDFCDQCKLIVYSEAGAAGRRAREEGAEK